MVGEGFGEQKQPRFRHSMDWVTWAMFARDHDVSGTANLYGI